APAAAHLLLPLPYPAQHVVQPSLAPHPAPDQVPQSAGRVGPAEHGVPELIQGQPGVIGRRERIRAVAVLTVPVSHVRALLLLPPSRALRLVAPEARQATQRGGWSSAPGRRRDAAAFGPAPAAFQDDQPFMCGICPSRAV